VLQLAQHVPGSPRPAAHSRQPSVCQAAQTETAAACHPGHSASRHAWFFFCGGRCTRSLQAQPLRASSGAAECHPGRSACSKACSPVSSSPISRNASSSAMHGASRYKPGVARLALPAAADRQREGYRGRPYALGLLGPGLWRVAGGGIANGSSSGGGGSECVHMSAHECTS
jgi:hypothetical protein